MGREAWLLSRSRKSGYSHHKHVFEFWRSVNSFERKIITSRLGFAPLPVYGLDLSTHQSTNGLYRRRSQMQTLIIFSTSLAWIFSSSSYILLWFPSLFILFTTWLCFFFLFLSFFILFVRKPSVFDRRCFRRIKKKPPKKLRKRNSTKINSNETRARGLSAWMAKRYMLLYTMEGQKAQV